MNEQTSFQYYQGELSKVQSDIAYFTKQNTGEFPEMVEMTLSTFEQLLRALRANILYAEFADLLSSKEVETLAQDCAKLERTIANLEERNNQ